MLESLLNMTEAVFCIVCGNEVDDQNFQLCDNEGCIERFKEMYSQVSQ